MLEWSQIRKGHNFVKTTDGVMLPVLCTLSDDVLCLCQVPRKHLKGFLSYKAGAICILKLTKGNKNFRNIGRLTVLCTSSDNTL